MKGKSEGKMEGTVAVFEPSPALLGARADGGRARETLAGEALRSAKDY